MPDSFVNVHSEPGPHVPDAPQETPDPCALVLFGVTGDLARRKIIPALYHLALNCALPRDFALVGFSRSASDDETLRKRLRAGLDAHSRTKPVDEDVWRRFAERIHAVSGSVDDTDAFQRLAQKLNSVATRDGTQGNLLFYFSTPPSVYPAILEQLGKAALLKPSRGARPGSGPAEPWGRVIIEKPFGHDLASALELNRLARRVAREHQIYRIDHYLGKETVQNILVFRFGNAIFEPVWNRRYIDHVQITMAEDIGVEGRGAFYEETG
ncbi:MAG: glucose-6-phosphate dehydrogenase, partial [Planctomycetota bacterium]